MLYTYRRTSTRRTVDSVSRTVEAHCPRRAMPATASAQMLARARISTFSEVPRDPMKIAKTTAEKKPRQSSQEGAAGAVAG